MNTTVQATVEREGRWWIITMPEIDVVTQSRHLKDVPEIAAEAAALALDTTEESLTINSKVVIPNNIKDLWEESRSKEIAARRTAQDAGKLARRAVHELREQGLTQRDAAVVLGISYQRVAQLEKAAELSLH